MRRSETALNVLSSPHKMSPGFRKGTELMQTPEYAVPQLRKFGTEQCAGSSCAEEPGAQEECQGCRRMDTCNPDPSFS